MTSILAPTLNPFHLSSLTPFTWKTDPGLEIDIPPSVIIIDEAEKQEPKGLVKKMDTCPDDDQVSLRLKDQADESGGDDEENIYDDAQEYLSEGDDEEDIYDDVQEYLSDVDQEEDSENESISLLPVQVYNSPNKTFYNFSPPETLSRDKFRSSSVLSRTTSMATKGSIGISPHSLYYLE